ncbi:MAG: nucleoside deaminase [Pseudolabrys sp.]
MSDEDFMREAVDLARANIRDGGRPFAALLVRDGEVIARAVNDIHRTNDPTGHAELQAIRQASQHLGAPRLDGSVMYASGHPCPMCLAAMHMCGVKSGFFCYSLEDGQVFGLGTTAIYQQMTKPPQQQSLPLRPLKPAGESGLYTEWLELQQ